jgi:mono/diheme cytochrome c family protein
MNSKALALALAVVLLPCQIKVLGQSSLYETQIKPIFESRCYACHGVLKQTSGLRLDTAASAIQGGDGGPAIVRNDANNSSLIQHISSQDLTVRMPPEGEPLKPTQIELIRQWIDAGAVAPADEKPEPDPREHWSFRPPEKLPLPQVNEDAWSKNPIDRWIWKQHRDRGVTPQRDAEPRIWLRRVYLDLIGLPPTLDELAAFENDPSPAAIDQVVTRLLDSPQYGERWGRHWMDIWRYSDAWGLGEEIRNSQKHLWRWRDWIIESLNEDKAYNQMLREMLAADELYPEQPSQLRATGFLARHYFKFNRTTWMDETVEHTAKAMLGLTMNCCKCHDHKYDPVTQREYYQWRAFFEPYQIRMDMIPGEFNFEKDAVTRVFDCNLDAPTFLHVRGDDRNPDRSQILGATLPQFLAPQGVAINPVSLPSHAFMPGIQPGVVAAYRDRALQTLEQAQSNLQSAQSQPENLDAIQLAEEQLQVAKLEQQSLEARLAADIAVSATPQVGEPSPELKSCLEQAARAQRLSDAQNAKYKLLKANIDLKAASDDKKPELQKLVDQATKEVEAANAEVGSPALTYRSVKGALKTLESNLEDEASRNKPFPRTSTGRRRALAEWIANQSNPLTARVAVNHIWSRHFGQPLVGTVFDFGRKGKRPTHPELLDFLAVDWMEHGWSMKYLHRLIVTSKTYRMSSSNLGAQDNRLHDPENQSLWRAPGKRMESQTIRDALLHLAGTLDLKVGGPSVAANDENSKRRSLYYLQSHNEHNDFLSVFDDANVLDCYRRTESIVPQQSLALANSKLVDEVSGPIANRIAEGCTANDHEAFVRNAFAWILAGAPNQDEVDLLLQGMQKFRDSARSRLGSEESAIDTFARKEIVRILLNHNDFITIR